MTLKTLAMLLNDYNYIKKVLESVSPHIDITLPKIESELRNSLVIKDGHHYVLVEVDK